MADEKQTGQDFVSESEGEQVGQGDFYQAVEVAQKAAGDEPAKVPDIPVHQHGVDMQPEAGKEAVPLGAEKPPPEAKVEPKLEPEPDKEPKTEPAEEAKAEEPESEEAEKLPWDPERQKRDQDRANLRKENEALKARLAQQEAVIERRELLDGVRPSDEVQAEIDALPELNDYTDPEQYMKQQKALNALTKELGRSIKAEAEISRVQAEASRQDNAAWEAILDDVAGTDKNLRNGVVNALRKEWDAEGYGPGNWPTSREVKAIAKQAAAEYRLEHPKTPPVKPKAKPVPTPDTGTRGAAPAPPTRPRAAGSIEDAIADIKAGR